MNTNSPAVPRTHGALTGAAIAATFGRLRGRVARRRRASPTTRRWSACSCSAATTQQHGRARHRLRAVRAGAARRVASRADAGVRSCTVNARRGRRQVSTGFHPNLTSLQRALRPGEARGRRQRRHAARADHASRDYKAGKNRPPNLFSHSDQQMRGRACCRATIVRTGWGGRLRRQAGRRRTPAQKIPTMVSVSGTQIFDLGHDTVPFVIPGNGGVLLVGPGRRRGEQGALQRAADAARSAAAATDRSTAPRRSWTSR